MRLLAVLLATAAIWLFAVLVVSNPGRPTVTHEQMHDGMVTATAPAHASAEIRK